MINKSEYILGIDSSSIELGIGLCFGNQPIMGMSRYIRNSHAEHIAQCIKFLLSSNNVSPFDIFCAGIAVGPGSFTGLRIGIAFIKGFFLAQNAKIVSVSSLEALAASWNVTNKNIVCVFDARNNNVYWARFYKENGITRRITNDTFCSIEELKTNLKDDDIILADTLGYQKSRAFDFLEENQNFFKIEKYPIQRGLACALLANTKIQNNQYFSDCSILKPVYLNVAPVRST